MSKLIKSVLTGAFLCAIALPARAEYFVILNTAPDKGRVSDVTVEKTKRDINRKCKIRSKSTQTSALRGMRDDLMIVFLDSYESRRQANAALQRVKRCIPGAYIKQADWLGDP